GNFHFSKRHGVVSHYDRFLRGEWRVVNNGFHERICASRPTNLWNRSEVRVLLAQDMAPLQIHRLGLVKAAVIDRELAVAVVGINLDETFAEPNVAPRVILLCLDGSWNDWVDSDNRCDQKGATCLEQLRGGTIKRAVFVDNVSKRQHGRERRQPVELEF